MLSAPTQNGPPAGLYCSNKRQIEKWENGSPWAIQFLVFSLKHKLENNKFPPFLLELEIINHVEPYYILYILISINPSVNIITYKASYSK